MGNVYFPTKLYVIFLDNPACNVNTPRMFSQSDMTQETERCTQLQQKVAEPYVWVTRKVKGAKSEIRRLKNLPGYVLEALKKEYTTTKQGKDLIIEYREDSRGSLLLNEVMSDHFYKRLKRFSEITAALNKQQSCLGSFYYEMSDITKPKAKSDVKKDVLTRPSPDKGQGEPTQPKPQTEGQTQKDGIINKVRNIEYKLFIQSERKIFFCL